jgi:hypothetical protein
MWQAAQWICALVALSCGAMPGVAVIQAAYDSAKGVGDQLHDDSLQVLQAKCRDDGTQKYLCEITFISKKDPDERPFFDVVTMARVAGGWELKSGLCKGHGVD